MAVRARPTLVALHSIFVAGMFVDRARPGFFESRGDPTCWVGDKTWEVCCFQQAMTKHCFDKVFSIARCCQGTVLYWEDRYHRYFRNLEQTKWLFTWPTEAEVRSTAAQVINLVAIHNLKSVVEFGCGEGDLGRLIANSVEQYVGLDVSRRAVSSAKDYSLRQCPLMATYENRDKACPEVGDRERHADGISWSSAFSVHHYDGWSIPVTGPFDLAISNNVIMHLLEDKLFDRYMRFLFGLSTRWVVIAGSPNENSKWPPDPEGLLPGHIRYRRFTDWVRGRMPSWHWIRKQDSNDPREMYYFVRLSSNTSFNGTPHAI